MPSRLLGAASVPAPRERGSGLQPGAAPSGHRHNRQQHGHAHQQPSPVEMPPYEPLSFPYNDKAKDDIALLYNHLKPSLTCRQEAGSSQQRIQDIVGPLNDVLFERRGALARLAARKKQEAGAAGNGELDASIAHARSSLASIESVITDITIELEAAARIGIDHEAYLDDEKRVIELAFKSTVAQKPPPEQRPPRKKEKTQQRKKPQRRVEDDDDDDDDGEEETEHGHDGEHDEHDGHQSESDRAPQEEPVAPMKGILEFLVEGRKAAEDGYWSMPMADRYATANSYIGFKRSMHDALFRDGKPVPHPSDWFDDNGPVILFGGSDEAPPPEVDDDLAIEGVVISTKCPLTMSVMKEPYRSNVCIHVYDKAAVISLLTANGGHAECPVGGCDKILHLGDFTPDPIMQRRIERERIETERQRRADRDDEDESDDD